MPQSKQTAIASSTNVIKINIGTKTKKKKPRKTRARKTAPIAPKRSPLPESFSPIPPPPVLMRSSNDVFGTSTRDHNMLRDIQLAQNALMDMSKNNSREILRISNPFHPSVFRDTLANLDDKKAVEEHNKKREEMMEQSRKRLAEHLDKKEQRIIEIRERRWASENPGMSSQSAGGGGSASYEAFKKEQQSEFRRLADASFQQTIEGFIEGDDLTGLKRFVSQQGGNAGYNKVGSLETMMEKISRDPELKRHFRGTYLRQDPNVSGYMQTPPSTPTIQSPDVELGGLGMMFGGGDGY